MDYKEIYNQWLENPYFDEATKEELKAEIETQKAMFYLQQQDNIPAFYSKWFLNRIKEECVYRLLQ